MERELNKSGPATAYFDKYYGNPTNFSAQSVGTPINFVGKHTPQNNDSEISVITELQAILFPNTMYTQKPMARLPGTL